MPATPIKYTPKKGALSQGQYADIEVPGDYEVVLVSVENYDKTDVGKSKGWVATYSCETQHGQSVNFDDYLSFSEAAQFKIDAFFMAHAPGVLKEEVEATLDPTQFIGTKVGARIDFPRNKQGEQTGDFRGIIRVYALVDEEEFFGESVATEDVADTTPVQAVEEVETI